MNIYIDDKVVARTGRNQGGIRLEGAYFRNMKYRYLHRKPPRYTTKEKINRKYWTVIKVQTFTVRYKILILFRFFMFVLFVATN